ncbi:hypothetical protein HYFRA_00009789 [Hymenoscyphus fraxineus]|uniref:Adenylyl cyclase-associated protein n=1 Tax=Hymenoscyphus fraxineus TaxID=746836 RepID=A0A9N9PWM9_9HELO|nr:hypothetical protein HYFRA_00009789 [Hymenoscyphus fraxineus]
MATNNMHNLTTLIKRLEAATSRLEDIASSTIAEPQGVNGAAPSPAPTGPLPPPPVAGAPPASKSVQEDIPEFVEDFDLFLQGPVKKFVALSDAIGGPISDQAAGVLRAFMGQRKFLLITAKAKKPVMDSPMFMELLKPLQEAISDVNEVRDKNRSKKEIWHHLSAVSESISVIAWVTLESKPAKMIEDCLPSAEYWGNRVLKEFKESDPKQVEWIQAYYQIFKILKEYIVETFPHGVPWNPKGQPLEEVVKGFEQPSKGAPPPPPPGPPPPPARFDEPAKPAPAPEVGGLDAVFSELNKGEAVTKGLRKVNPDQMTHKNPSLRAGASVPTRSDSSASLTSRAKSPAAPSKKPKPEGMRTKKPPVKRLEGNKWIIENYDNEPNPIEIHAEISHSILISRCTKTTIMVKGKANAISIDNCPRLSLIIESLVSSIDVIKASNFGLQVTGTLPTIMMDQVDGAQIYLGKESMKTEVFSSKCSSINLLLLEDDDEDYKEVALPEQIRSYIGDNGKVASEIVEHAG